MKNPDGTLRFPTEKTELRTEIVVELQEEFPGLRVHSARTVQVFDLDDPGEPPNLRPVVDYVVGCPCELCTYVTTGNPPARFREPVIEPPAV